MAELNLKVKKHENFYNLKQRKPGDAGIDLYASENKAIEPRSQGLVKVGISVSFSPDYYLPSLHVCLLSRVLVSGYGVMVSIDDGMMVPRSSPQMALAKAPRTSPGKLISQHVFVDEFWKSTPPQNRQLVVYYY